MNFRPVPKSPLRAGNTKQEVVWPDLVRIVQVKRNLEILFPAWVGHQGGCKNFSKTRSSPRADMVVPRWPLWCSPTALPASLEATMPSGTHCTPTCGCSKQAGACLRLVSAMSCAQYPSSRRMPPCLPVWWMQNPRSCRYLWRFHETRSTCDRACLFSLISPVALCDRCSLSIALRALFL